MTIKLNELLTRVSKTHFSPVVIGPVKVSIQASSFHYCTPRRDLVSAEDYATFEVAIFLNQEFFHPEEDQRFYRKSWAQYWSAADDVAGNVPKAHIQQMLEDLNIAFCN